MPRKTAARRWSRPSARCRFNEAAARCRGKLLPGPPFYYGYNLASMRPRPDAAENVGASAEATLTDLASMRPRPDAAENAGVAARTGATIARLQ